VRAWRLALPIPAGRSPRNRAKAILAACSHERTIPKDAKAFLELLEQYRLGTVSAESTATTIGRG
jgi:hypothetical protein